MDKLNRFFANIPEGTQVCYSFKHKTNTYFYSQTANQSPMITMSAPGVMLQ
jgi:hypothetical protein